MSYVKETAKETGQGIVASFQFLIWFAIVFFGLGIIGFTWYKFSAPAIEQVRYDTFKNSQAYNDGMLRDLYDLKRDYEAADTEHKGALKALVIHRFEIYDKARLPTDLQTFYYSIAN